MRRTPLRRYTYLRKRRSGPPRRGREHDPKYLAWIRTQPCSVPGCGSRYVEAAHVGPRGYGVRCDDRKAISLCSEHHWRGSESHHRLGRQFWWYWNLDRYQVIDELNERYDAEFPGRRDVA